MDDANTRKLALLIDQGQRIVLPGVVLQELLQGIRDESVFSRVKAYMEAFPMLDLDRQTYVLAAELHSLCRSKGVQTTTIDVQIAAACVQYDYQLLTSDQDFVYIARHCPLQLL